MLLMSGVIKNMQFLFVFEPYRVIIKVFLAVSFVKCKLEICREIERYKRQ